MANKKNTGKSTSKKTSSSKSNYGSKAPIKKPTAAKMSYNPDWENKKFVAKGDMMVPERKKSTSSGTKKSTTAKKPTTSFSSKLEGYKVTPRLAPDKKAATTKKRTTTKPKNSPYVKGVVEGLIRPPQKKKTVKKPVPKPVAPKMPTIIGSTKASVPSKGKVKIEPNLGKPKSFTPPKTETKPKVTAKPKPTPAPEPIKMETIPLATVAKQLQESQRTKLPSTIEVPKSVATTPKTPAPAEEKKGLFARMKERREERRAEREAEKTSTAKMKKGGMVKTKKVKTKKR